MHDFIVVELILLTFLRVIQLSIQYISHKGSSTLSLFIYYYVYNDVNVAHNYNRSQKLLRQTRKTASYLKPQAIENSFKRAYGEVEDNIIIYIERLKT